MSSSMFTEQGIWKQTKLIIFLFYCGLSPKSWRGTRRQYMCELSKEPCKDSVLCLGTILNHSNSSQSPDCLQKDALSRNAGRINTDHLHTWKDPETQLIYGSGFSLFQKYFLVASMRHGSFKLLSHIWDSKLLVVVSQRSILLLKKLISKWTKLSNPSWTYKNYCNQVPWQEYHRT